MFSSVNEALLNLENCSQNNDNMLFIFRETSEVEKGIFNSAKPICHLEIELDANFYINKIMMTSVMKIHVYRKVHHCD